jgi:glycine hydroxymethyltransferase
LLVENYYQTEFKRIYKSILDQQKIFEETLILNPVENIPFPDILTPSNTFMHGLYNTDTRRDDAGKKKSKIQFSGRDTINADVFSIYELWADLLDARFLSMRLLSGLHAHIILFMSLTDIGDHVVVLPEKGGGHTSGVAILNRLGLNTMEMILDTPSMHVDILQTKKLIEQHDPHVIFVDRSEGLIYEDFSWLSEFKAIKIFDASQYLTNVMCKDYQSPFNMGFDIVLSTLHKNLPGPQRALACCNDEKIWNRLKPKISTYVSNMHVFSIYSAGLILGHFDDLKRLSKNMLINAVLLEKCLEKTNVPVVKRDISMGKPTHHCWIKCKNSDEAFDFFRTLEALGLMTNYRLLPYDIGYGIRLGLSGATQSGLRSRHIKNLADIISHAYHDGFSNLLFNRTRSFICEVKSNRINSSYEE